MPVKLMTYYFSTADFPAPAAGKNRFGGRAYV